MEPNSLKPFARWSGAASLFVLLPSLRRFAPGTGLAIVQLRVAAVALGGMGPRPVGQWTVPLFEQDDEFGVRHVHSVWSPLVLSLSKDQALFSSTA